MPQKLKLRHFSLLNFTYYLLIVDKLNLIEKDSPHSREESLIDNIYLILRFAINLKAKKF
jgi:hypothetical protein